MKIDKIKKLKNNKYKLYLSNDENVTTYDDVIIENNLLSPKEINSTLLNKVEIDTKYYDIYNKTINYINIRLRSRKEIETYLDKNNVLKEDKEKIINKLIDLGLIDDKKFTRAFINDKLLLSNYGPNKIIKDLINYGIDEVIIEEEINNIGSDILNDKIIKLINKKIKNNNKYSNYQLKQKVIIELMNLGFDKEIILNNFEKINLDDNDILLNQYNKIYNKLSRKYNGDELYLKIKQELYKKGFNYNEINNLINEKIGI